jgi:hypothetical protein
VHNILNEHYLGCWIGCGSPASPVPLSWPPYSPDLTTLNNSLWGIIKGQVAAHLYHNNNEVCIAVEQVFTTIMPRMLWYISHRTWQCIRICFEHNAAHTDPLDVHWLSPHGM